MNGTDFWARINALIKQNKTTQENIAKECDINFGTFKNQSSNKTVPDVFEAVKIAAALGTTVEYLATGESPAQNAASIPLSDLKEFISRYG